VTEHPSSVTFPTIFGEKYRGSIKFPAILLMTLVLFILLQIPNPLEQHLRAIWRSFADVNYFFSSPGRRRSRGG